MSATIFQNLHTFKHGVHPEEAKALTSNAKIERMPFQESYTLPLSQHAGAPSVPIVKVGDTVKRGQEIAEPGGFVSVSLHAPVDGVVVAIDLFDHPKGGMQPAIKIRTDQYSAQVLTPLSVPDPGQISTNEFVSWLQRGGLVGMGGAAFPTHVKFAIPEGKQCRYLMLNGCECEPYLTCDHRTMVEYYEELMDGTAIVQQFVQADRIFIAIEANKPDAIEILTRACDASDLPIEVVPLQVKYPQGAEKMMITAILGEEVPSGKLPLDVGTMVSNVGTMVAVSELFRKGKPVIERVVTVTGEAVRRPANVLVPVGTSMKEVVSYCGGLTDDMARILLGGPMMGAVQKSLDIPVLKGTSGILALAAEEVAHFVTYSCIRCGRCLEACPLFLNPARMGLLARKGLWSDMEQEQVLDCFECAACSFVCPSGIPLVQSFRVAKAFIREERAREKEKIA